MFKLRLVLLSTCKVFTDYLLNKFWILVAPILCICWAFVWTFLRSYWALAKYLGSLSWAEYQLSTYWAQWALSEQLLNNSLELRNAMAEHLLCKNCVLNEYLHINYLWLGEFVLCTYQALAVVLWVVNGSLLTHSGSVIENLLWLWISSAFTKHFLSIQNQLSTCLALLEQS